MAAAAEAISQLSPFPPHAVRATAMPLRGHSAADATFECNAATALNRIPISHAPCGAQSRTGDLESRVSALRRAAGEGQQASTRADCRAALYRILADPSPRARSNHGADVAVIFSRCTPFYTFCNRSRTVLPNSRCKGIAFGQSNISLRN